MKCYNVKEISYNDGTKQVIVYDSPVFYDVENTGESVRYCNDNGVEFNPETGEIRSESQKEHCINSSLSRTKQTIYNIAHNNKWEYFITITISEENEDRYNYNKCVKLLSKWLNNMKHQNPDMIYLIVPEMHEDGAFHFHGLLSHADLKLTPAINAKTGKKIRGVYNIGAYKWGFTTCSKVRNTVKCSSYISKYITKSVLTMTANRKRYFCSKGLEKLNQKKQYITDEAELEKMVKKADYVKRVKVKGTESYVTYYHMSE